MPRTIVIGDIHGALKALKQVIDEIRPQQEDLLIFLGDYVDGWSESAQVIEYVMELNKSIPCIFIKGNHDAWCEGWLDGASPSPIWLANGGQATIESYANISIAKKHEHLAFFRSMYNYYVDAQNRLFIHAGFSSMHGPAYEHYQSNYSWDRTLWEMALAMDKGIEKDALTYPKRLLLFHEIYIGHTPTLRYNKDVPMQACNVWNIDTGAAFTGKISAMDIDTREVWQSDPAPMLYPDEKGRNK